MSVPAQFLAAPLLIRLLTVGLGKVVEDCPKVWTPATTVGDFSDNPGSKFWPGPGLILPAIREVNQQIQYHSSLLFLFLSLFNSFKLNK